jgi:RHS repeat-associated protein
VSEYEALPSSGDEYAVVPANKTLFSSYDPFGRARVITAPDAKQTTFAFKGIAQTRRTSKIALGGTSDTAVTTTETYDRHGRLMRVEEPTSNGTTATNYEYDLGDRLTSVVMQNGTASQQRLFQYDERGLLQEEQHPELGASGNGTTVYGTYSGPTFNGSYDARGHATRKVTGSVDVTTVFDGAERVTEVKNTGGDTLKLFLYDDIDGTPSDCTSYCGKLAATARYNIVPGIGTVAVTEAYQYGGVGGRVSVRDVVAGTTSQEWEHFVHGQTYNDLGAVKSVTYPCRYPACDRTAPSVPLGYTRGMLTSVGSLSSSIAYQPNGAIDTVTHEGGIREKWTPDPDGMARPAKIQVLNASNVELWSSGDYKYDGSGNVKQAGEMTYTYDRQNRLTQWTRTSGSTTASTVRGYDPFGNFTYTTEKGCTNVTQCYSTGILSYPINSQTNHYNDLTYDTLGDVTTESGRTFTYDSLGVMMGANVGGRSFRYLYTASDERVGLVEIGFAQGKRITWTLRGLDDQLLSTWNDDTTTGTRVVSWKEDQYWRGNALLASKNSSGTKHFALDHLGCPRYVTSASGSYIGTQNFQPFGEGGTLDGGPNQFTGHERDGATVGNGTTDLPDYMHARFYDLRLGRFLSIDPAPATVYAQTPQSWNLYSYAFNNPLRFVDPTGRVVQCVPNSDPGKPPICGESIDVEGEIPKAPSIRGGIYAAIDFVNWIFGRLPSDTAAHPDSARDLSNTPAMQNVRDQYKDSGCKDDIYEPEQFGPKEFLNTRSLTGHLVGGFSASIRSLGNGMIVVKATNTWGRESMSRWPGATNRNNPTLEDMGSALLSMAHQGSISPSVLHPRSTLSDSAVGPFATTRVNYIWMKGTPCTQ